MRPWPWVLPAVIAAAIVGLPAAAEEDSDGEAASKATIEIFDVDIPLLDGGVLRAGDLRGKYLVVDVWGTWCGTCRRVMPRLIEIQTRFGGRGVEVIGVSAEVSGDYATAVRRAKEFAAELGVNYRLGILDPAIYGKIRNVMKFENDDFTVPSTFVVDREGVIIGRYPGYFFGQEDEIADLLAQRLAAEAGGSGGFRDPAPPRP